MLCCGDIELRLCESPRSTTTSVVDPFPHRLLSATLIHDHWIHVYSLDQLDTTIADQCSCELYTIYLQGCIWVLHSKLGLMIPWNEPACSAKHEASANWLTTQKAIQMRFKVFHNREQSSKSRIAARVIPPHSHLASESPSGLNQVNQGSIPYLYFRTHQKTLRNSRSTRHDVRYVMYVYYASSICTVKKSDATRSSQKSQPSGSSKSLLRLPFCAALMMRAA